MITIYSRNKLIEVVTNVPNTHDVICITESSIFEMIPEVAKNAKSYLWLRFDDIEFSRTGYIAPDKQRIKEALDWAKDKESILVACLAGISRSSAIAYLIQCMREDHPKDALKILAKRIHHPNSLIVKLGAEILEDGRIIDEYRDWLW